MVKLGILDGGIAFAGTFLVVGLVCGFVFSGLSFVGAVGPGLSVRFVSIEGRSGFTLTVVWSIYSVAERGDQMSFKLWIVRGDGHVLAGSWGIGLSNKLQSPPSGEMSNPGFCYINGYNVGGDGELLPYFRQVTAECPFKVEQRVHPLDGLQTYYFYKTHIGFNIIINDNDTLVLAGDYKNQPDFYNGYLPYYGPKGTGDYFRMGAWEAPAAEPPTDPVATPLGFVEKPTLASGTVFPNPGFSFSEPTPTPFTEPSAAPVSPSPAPPSALPVASQSVVLGTSSVELTPVPFSVPINGSISPDAAISSSSPLPDKVLSPMIEFPPELIFLLVVLTIAFVVFFVVGFWRDRRQDGEKSLTKLRPKVSRAFVLLGCFFWFAFVSL